MANAADQALTDPLQPVAAPEEPCWNVTDQAWIISRYRDVHSVLRSGSVRSGGPGGQLERTERRTGTDHPHLAAVLRGAPLFQHGDELRASRDAARGMLAETARRFGAPELRRRADALVEQAPIGPSDDVLAILADPLPSIVAADMLHLDLETLRWLRRCGREVSGIWRVLPRLRDYERLERVCTEVHTVLAKTSFRLWR